MHFDPYLSLLMQNIFLYSFFLQIFADLCKLQICPDPYLEHILRSSTLSSSSLKTASLRLKMPLPSIHVFFFLIPPLFPLVHFLLPISGVCTFLVFPLFPLSFCLCSVCSYSCVSSFPWVPPVLAPILLRVPLSLIPGWISEGSPPSLRSVGSVSSPLCWWSPSVFPGKKSLLYCDSL